MKKNEVSTGVVMSSTATKEMYGRIQKPYRVYSDKVEKTVWGKDITEARERFKTVYGDVLIRGVVAV